MSRPRSLLVLSVVVGLAAVVYLAAASDTETPPAEGSGGSRLGLDGQSTGPNALSAEGEEASSTGDAVPTVRVEIERTALVEVLPPRPRLRVLKGTLGDEALDAGVEWIAGSAAIRGGDPEGAQLVRITLPDGDVLYRVVRLVPGEEAVVRLDGGLPVFGRVVDPDGAAVVGARVWLAGRPEVETDLKGRFSVDGLRSRAGLPLVIYAEGFAHRFRIVEAVADQEEEAPTYHLDRAARVNVILRGLPKDGRGKVFYGPPPGAEPDLAMRHFPFFWPLIGEFVSLEDGNRGPLRGLPAGVPWTLVPHHPLADAPKVDVRRPRQSATQSHVVWDAANRGRRPVRGRVVHPDGSPAAGALVVCRARPGPLELAPDHDFLLPPSVRLGSIEHAYTSADGRFEVARPADAHQTWITVHPSGDGYGLKRRVRGNDELQLTLPAVEPVTGTPALRLSFERDVRLIVVDGGSASPSVQVQAGVPYEVEFARPVVVDVTIRWEQRRILPLTDLAVVGVVGVSF